MKATSKITTETVIKPVEVETKTIILELTVEDARWIESITHMIGGSPITTPRGIFDSLGSVLRDNLEPSDLLTHEQRKDSFSNSIYFR